MANLFISGWGCDISILPPECHNVTFFDTTKELARLENLQSWKESILPKVQSVTTKNSVIVGWSTGAILLLPLLENLCYKEVHLYAPCLQFVASEKNPLGTKAIHLQSMISALSETRELTMKKFFRNCGKSDAIAHSISYSTEVLQKSLQFLKEVMVTSSNSQQNVTLYHGEKDRIIPQSAGKIVAKELSLPLQSLKGGHFQKQMFSHF